jgi:hypothetical protein
MWLILLFRVCLLLSFILATLKWGDVKNWRKYYPTLLFVMVINLSISFITYHNQFWIFKPDSLVSTETVIELLNTYILLPATVLLYLANYPDNAYWRNCIYTLGWIFAYSAIEFVDAKFIGGISYAHGWKYAYSPLFDLAMFTIIRLHHDRPLLAWLVTSMLATAVLICLGILSAELK